MIYLRMLCIDKICLYSMVFFMDTVIFFYKKTKQMTTQSDCFISEKDVTGINIKIGNSTFSCKTWD